MRAAESLLVTVVAAVVVLMLDKPAQAAIPASDAACNSGYSGSGDWTGNNGGAGFSAWSGKITTGGGLFKRGSSGVNDNNSGAPDINTSCSGSFSWGLNAGGGAGNTAQVTRVFAQGSTASSALLVGQVFTIDMDNGYVDNGNPAGFSLQNSSGQNVFDFRFVANQQYQINSSNTGVPYTGHGLRITFTLTTSSSFQITVATPNTGSPTTFTGNLLNPAGGQAIDRVTLYARAIGGGGATSSYWDLYFNSMSISCPAFTATVPDTNVCSGATASFTVSASTTNALAYQWQVSTDNGNNWNPVTGGSGATTVTYTTPTLVSGDNGKQYRALLTSVDCGNTITSAVATLSVVGAPNITTQPSAQVVYAGGDASFIVVATATGYQWYKGPTGSGAALSNGGSVSGAASATLALSSLTLADHGASFYVVVSSCTGSPVTSAGASLTVTEIDPFLKASGRSIRDRHGSGDVVPLRGANFGAWLLMEGWMCPMDSSGQVSDHYSVVATLDSRFGVATEQSLLRTYQNAWIAIQDLNNIRALGMNLIRVPIMWTGLQQLDGTWRADAFDRLDWVVSNAWQRGIYTMLDLHGAPGGVSPAQSSGTSSNAYWTSTAYKNQTALIWSNIAAHFVGNPAVAGYDLLNEPSGAPTRQAIWDAYNSLYQTVRAVDPDHIIIMENTWSGAGLNWQWDVLPSPSTYNWSNVVYSAHAYAGSSGGVTNEVNKQTSDFNSHSSWNVPCLIGEFQGYDSSNAWQYAVTQFNTNGMSWANWSYKATAGTVGNSWGIYDPNSLPTKPNLQTDSAAAISNDWRVLTTPAGFAITTFLRRTLGGPLAVADSYSATSGVTLVVSSGSGVLTNDIDANLGQSGIQLSAVLVDGPTNGQLTLNSNGSFSYVPNGGFTGVDTFRYRANDNYQTSVNIATVTIQVNPPPVPAAPTGLAATAGDGFVALNWNSSVADGYNVKRAVVSGGPYGIVTNGLLSTTYTDLGVVDGTTYYYVVTAFNAYGESTNSTEASALPLSAYQQWQILYFGSLNNPLGAPDVDADGDGLSNLQEFLAGTDPTNSVDAFRITRVVATGSDVFVSWTTGVGKTNALQVTAGDASGDYSTNDFATVFTVTNTIEAFTNYLDSGALTNAPRFYRVRLVP